MAPAPKVDTSAANPDVLTKYKTAGEIAQAVLAEVKKLVVPGAKVLDVTTKGDELLAEATSKVYKSKKDMSKGIAFPTAISLDDCVAYYSPVEGDAPVEIKAGSVAKIMVGAQIDGFASIVSDSIIVGGGEPSQEVKNAIAGAWYASEAALRTFQPGKRNSEVTRVVDLATKDLDVTALEGMLTMQHVQNNISGKKRVIINPSDGQRRDFETQAFEVGDVFGLDILVSTTGSSGKTHSDDTPTNVFRKTDLTYQLKLRSSRLAISDVQKKAGPFPFSVKILDDQRRARLALKEPLDHGLVESYDVVSEREGKPVIQFFTTFAVTKNGIVKLAAPSQPNLEGAKPLENEEVKDILRTSLKANKKKSNK